MSRDARDDEVDDLALLDRRLVQVGSMAATAFLVVSVALWLATGEQRFALQIAPPLIVSTAGWVMIALDRPKAVVHLVIAAAALVLYVSLSDGPVPGDPLFGLFAMLIAGAALVRTHIIVYTVMGSIGLSWAAVAWHAPQTGVAAAISETVALVVTFCLTAWLLHWQRSRSRRDRERLRRLVASKDEFVATISHELRTPLTSLVAIAHELDESPGDFTHVEREELISLLVAESSDMTDIVEDLLVVARDDIGRLTVDRRVLDVSCVVAAVVSDLRGAEVAVDVGDSLQVLSDELRTRQIVRNLVGNALRYGGDTVRVTARRSGSEALIEVRDDGPPLDGDERAEIFEAYRSAARVSGRPGSMGLGLTVSRRLARILGGDVDYDHDGNEAIFTLSLPLADATDHSSHRGDRTLGGSAVIDPSGEQLVE